MFKSWYKRMGYAFVIMMAVVIMAGTKTYATEEIQLPVMVNPLYEQQITEITIELEELQGATLNATGDMVYTSFEDAAKYVRQQMAARSVNISYTVSNALYTQHGTDVFYTVFDLAMEHTEECTGQEGDALRYGWSGCAPTLRYTSAGDITVAMEMTYYSSAAQEEALTAAVNSAMAGLALDGKSYYEKVKAIYNYICDNVDYDYENLNDKSYTIKYSAYAAMINKKAVCQGYAILFYRMCKEAGIPVRVIAGTGNGGGHAWNIVKVGDYYYNVDCTWDGQDSVTRSNYFLKSEVDFGNHERDDEFDTEEFHSKYVMSPKSYGEDNSVQEGADVSNFMYAYTTIEDTAVTSTADGKPKVLIFFSTECAYSQYAFKSLKDTEISNVDIIGIECKSHTKDEVTAFAKEYAGDDVEICYDTDSGIGVLSMWKYVEAVNGSDATIDYFPVIVYIDKDNRIQHVTTSMQSGNQIRNNLISYCGYVVEEEEEDSADENDTVKANGLTYVDGIYIFLRDGVQDTTVTGLVPYDGEWFYIVKGELSKTSGFVKYDGETFYVAAGRMVAEANGLVEYNGEWYLVAAGRVVSEYTGLAEYDGAWFYVSGGKMDATKKGMVEYDDGLFYVGAGKIMKHVSGLAQDPVTKKWYFIADGQVQKQHTGLALYDGQWFYVVKGEFANTYTGYVTYNESKFYVVKGEVQS